MSNWSKEDKAVYNNSEIFQEFEKRTIENIFRLDMLRKKAQQNASQSTLKATTDAAKAATEAVRELGKVKKEVGLAEDQLSSNSDDYMISGQSEELFNSMMKNKMDDDISDTIINELMEMKEAAIAEGNIKLAYKIERTLDEILSVEVI